MIWSEKCINPDYGFDIQKDGSMKPRRLGNFVLTIEECKKILNGKM